MPVLPISGFLNLLQGSQTLSAAQLTELRNSAAAKSGNLRAVGKLIYDKGWLTRFQIALIANGKETQIGPYRLLDRIGEGGMGQVYKACHVGMNRIVALKIIRKERLNNPKAVTRFLREIQAAAELVHPNIVMAYDAGQSGSTHYFAMEYVDGIDLDRMVKQSGPLPVGQACDFICQAAHGLQHAHEQGLVHRDIKPSNLLVARLTPTRLIIKILDMGLARLRGAGSDSEHGTVVGTPHYLPPERALNPQSVDIRGDIYSLGCTLYFLLAGQPPFEGDSITELLMKHQMEEYAPIRQYRPEVSEALAALVHKAMAKRPEERFQVPSAMAEALTPFCDSPPGGVARHR
jgi:serine/threonine-protein kinase